MTQDTGFKISVDEPSDNVSPLIRFKGTLKEHRQQVREVNGKNRMSVAFDFIDITVIESREPYPFPITTTTIPYSDRSETRWAAFTKSFRNLVPKESWSGLDDPLSVLDGKEVEMYFTSAKLRLPVKDENGEDTGKWGTQDGEAWQIMSVEGFGHAGADSKDSLMDMIVDYADGKKDSEIYQWLYTDQDIKGSTGYNEVIEAVAERKLLTTLVDGKSLTQDSDGIYHKVG